MNALDLLGSMADAAPAKKGKGDKPDVSDTSLEPLVDAWIKAHRDYKDAEARMKTIGDQINSHVAPERLAICTRTGEVQSSVTVCRKVVYTSKCQYCNVAADAAMLERMKQAFGVADFVRYIKPKLELSLTDAAANDPSIADHLVRVLGAPFIQANFDIKKPLKVTEQFHNDYTCRADVRQKAQEFVDCQVIKPYAATLKVK